MTKAIRIHEHGGPEVLQWEDMDIGAPGDGEVRIRHTAVGLNFIDCYQRSGLYPMDLPLTLGTEAAGVIEAVGLGVEGFAVGQRVAYAGGQMGSYAEERIMNAGVLVPMPDGIEDQTAAAMMLKGMTAHMLLVKCYPVSAGDTILVHAAAGGVGTILCQWAKHLGATVIGTVGSDAKAEIAKAHGCDHAINYSTENFVERVREITGDAGVPVVYDSVGKDTFEGSLDCTSKFGYVISFGNASGPAPAVEPLTLMAKGSLFLGRPTLIHYTADHALRLEAARALFEAVEGGAVKIEVGQTFPLAETAKAHAALEGRATTGSTVLLP
ncbi:MAG: quinone oxidoreductase [Rhodospirillaceae bacterium]|jgi:NADPH2:quinone reductase|nr:quinone oxidoreductase [Rhodospirillaceae bacterium]MBT3886154.1 quinone oxidoreductase [Rhodospirillaceae bacterium]MBT4118225.1 quinone oxidoreductase [Rhodospirillaceae bacterium]MBT4673068.1 quinone oxidoreductase [Rhodospirillaceae bacterium]MBT4721330.1 quinone oxidoreductase [Rhodospirillaceae bacterium]